MKLAKMFTAALVFSLLTSAVAVISSQAAQPDRTALKGSAPAWANTKNFRGTADPTGGVGFRVYLGWKDSAAAEALARAVSDPNSPSYGQYLTPVQFRKQFAPSQAQVSAVQSWLRSQGFS